MKRVSFSESEPTIVVKDPITDEDATLLYYSRDELAEILSHCKASILGEVKEECRRGLELVNTPDQQNQRKQILGKILLEQWRQRMTKYSAPNALAKVARDATAPSRKLALSRGKQDARAARDGVWKRITSGSIGSLQLKGTKYRVENSNVEQASRRSSVMGRTI